MHLRCFEEPLVFGEGRPGHARAHRVSESRKGRPGRKKNRVCQCDPVRAGSEIVLENKKLLGTSASLLVTSALLVVTRS